MHKLNLGTRLERGIYTLTFECVCGRVFAKKNARQATHVELREVIDAGVRACLLDGREARHGALAREKCPATAFEQEAILAAEGITERTELPGGRVASGSGTTPNPSNASAAVSLNPS